MSETPLFLVPADLPGPSGGTVYNNALIRELAPAGRLDVEFIPGRWPRPSRGERGRLAAAIQRAGVVVIDGIMALAAPELLTSGRTARVYILVHSLLSAEVGASERERAFFIQQEQAAIRAAHGVITTSAWAAREIRGAAALHVVRPGTDPAPIARGSDPPHLLMLGAVTPVKNQLTALDALGALADLPWKASIVGSAAVVPGYASEVRRQAQQRFETGRVHVLGVREGDDLERVWGRTDLLVLTSVSETFGMVVIEALARGIPAIVPAGTGAVEALNPAGAPHTAPGQGRPPTPGAALDPQEPDEIAGALRGWLTHRARRRRWRQAALKRRSSLRTWGQAAAEFDGMLKQ